MADEPTGDLDSKTSRDVIELILEMNRRPGITFMVVTHIVLT